LNKTNAKTIARLYGNNPGAWTGKLITLYPATTSVGGEDMDCIRVRNETPKRAAAKPKPAATPAPEPVSNGHDYPAFPAREPGDDTDEPPMGALEVDSAH
jgi:hypothetical protein